MCRVTGNPIFANILSVPQQECQPVYLTSISALKIKGLNAGSSRCTPAARNANPMPPFLLLRHLLRKCPARKIHAKSHRAQAFAIREGSHAELLPSVRLRDRR